MENKEVIKVLKDMKDHHIAYDCYSDDEEKCRKVIALQRAIEVIESCANSVEGGGLRIERIWAMPNKWTFKIKPIKALLDSEVNGFCCDPYCGENGNKYAQVTNDLALGGIDALEFLKQQKANEFDCVLLDPPYSLRQVSEHYKKAGVKITGWHTSVGYNSSLKNEAARIIKTNGKCICFGWNSMGLGKNRGFKMIRILLVPHGGSKNDTIVTVETKLQEAKSLKGVL